MANLFQPVRGYQPEQPDVLGSFKTGYDGGKGFAEDYYAKKDEARSDELANEIRSAMTDRAMGTNKEGAMESPLAGKKEQPKLATGEEQPSFIKDARGTTYPVSKQDTPKLVRTGKEKGPPDGFYPPGTYEAKEIPQAKMPTMSITGKQGQEEEKSGVAKGMDIPIHSPPSGEEMKKKENRARMGIEGLESWIRMNPVKWQELVRIRGGAQQAINWVLGTEFALQNTEDTINRNEIADETNRINNDSARLQNEVVRGDLQRTQQADLDTEAKKKFMNGFYQRYPIDEISSRLEAGEKLADLMGEYANETGQIIPPDVMTGLVSQVQEEINAERTAKRAFDLEQFTSEQAHNRALHLVRAKEEAKHRAENSGTGNGITYAPQIPGGTEGETRLLMQGKNLYRHLNDVLEGETGGDKASKYATTLNESRSALGAAVLDIEDSYSAFKAIDYYVAAGNGSLQTAYDIAVANEEWGAAQFIQNIITREGIDKLESPADLFVKIRTDMIAAMANYFKAGGRGLGFSSNFYSNIEEDIKDTNSGVYDEIESYLKTFLYGGIDDEKVKATYQTISGFLGKLRGKYDTSDKKYRTYVSGLIVGKGKIYLSDEQGNIALDGNGNPKLASQDQISAALLDVVPNEVHRSYPVQSSGYLAPPAQTGAVPQNIGGQSQGPTQQSMRQRGRIIGIGDI